MKSYILISDAQQLFKESVASLINKEIDKDYICKQYCTYETLVQNVKAISGNIKLIILSTNLIDIGKINKRLPDLRTITKTPILVITSINNRFFAQEVIDSGATYCLVKTTSHERCKEVINKILSGKQIDPFKESKSEIYSNKLTKRQYEVLSEIAQGMLNKQIANKLRISESTVKIHISSILVKLSVNNRTEAAIKFFQEA
ncbi:hypothetical protein [uncultured Gammaproteobacteria bacterium]|nr:hypothetical protein [uncultured Gammaproteobacteria bacterium]CAC9535744.1 hypothetical protein [uncultured Gammaproteobacteria bacterium]